MAGCRAEILDQIMQDHPDYKIGIATDIDDKGKHFFDSYKDAHPDYQITRVPSPVYKDWNDALRNYANRKLKGGK